LRRIRLLLATFALVGTAFAISLSPVMAQEDVVQEVVEEDVDQEDVDQEDVDQEDVAPAEGLAPGVVVLFDEEGNPFSCSSVDINADGVSELLCVPQTGTDETATDDTVTVESDTGETDTGETDTDDDELDLDDDDDELDLDDDDE
jgi:hypothetical protein